LVGNPESAAALEITAGGLRARFEEAATIAMTGASCPLAVGGRARPLNCSVRAPAGSAIEVGTPTRGVRTYLAVRGGLDAPPVLGSRATDLVAGLGPGALRAGDQLPIGHELMHYAEVDLAPVAALSDSAVIRLLPGPRWDWFTSEAMHVLHSATYTVQPASSRIGVRLSGPPLVRHTSRELPSEPTVLGAVEVPPDGQPILFLADRPTTCGYPVIAVAEPGDVDLASQLRPGQQVRFQRSRPADLPLKL
jgi:biotin-dependent carboxylase-like uncharacterized protein